MCTIEAGVLFNHTRTPHGRNIGTARGYLRLWNGFNRSAGPGCPRRAAAHHRPAPEPVSRASTGPTATPTTKASSPASPSGKSSCTKPVSTSTPQPSKSSTSDARMWTTENPAMLAWQLQLKQRGLLTAILSNMGDNVLASVERDLQLAPSLRCPHLELSVAHGQTRPRHLSPCLDKLGVRPEESLFLDDKLINVEAAHALGIKAIHFTTIERLRARPDRTRTRCLYSAAITQYGAAPSRKKTSDVQIERFSVVLHIHIQSPNIPTQVNE